MEMSDGWQDFSSQQTCEAKQIVYQFSDQGAGTEGKLNCQINLENFDNFSSGAHNVITQIELCQTVQCITVIYARIFNVAFD